MAVDSQNAPPPPAGVLGHFALPPRTLHAFLLRVAAAYRPLPYHNFRRAVDAAQLMYDLLLVVGREPVRLPGLCPRCSCHPPEDCHLPGKVVGLVPCQPTCHVARVFETVLYLLTCPGGNNGRKLSWCLVRDSFVGFP